MENADKELTDIYKVTRAQIEHPNNILAQRVIWLVIAQSFFFLGYASLICGNPGNPDFQKIQHILLIIFPIASLLTVVFSYIDILVLIRYQKKLKTYYYKQQERLATKDSYPPINGYYGFLILENMASILIHLYLSLLGRISYYVSIINADDLKKVL